MTDSKTLHTQITGYYPALFESLDEMVLVIRDRQIIEYMNPEAVKFFSSWYNFTNDQRPLHLHGSETDLLLFLDELFTEHASPDSCRLIFKETSLDYILSPLTTNRTCQMHWVLLRKSDIRPEIPTHLDYEFPKTGHNAPEPDKSDNTLNLKMSYPGSPDAIIGNSPSLNELKEMIKQVAPSDATILITGESGTGKELIANLILETSSRSDKPYLKINCNTINDSLLESDLFGHEKGAFTGAEGQRKGKFEVVDGGTIFLDEIGDISSRMQAALLRVLQNGEVIRVGGNTPIKVDVRIIAATNTDIVSAVHEGSFRLDLYYRLNVINIFAPPLRKRKEDIPDLVRYLISRYCRIFGKDIRMLPWRIMEKLLEHDWPGNVRELENIVQRAVLMAKTDTITEHELLFDPRPDKPTILPTDHDSLNGALNPGLKAILSETERSVISHSLTVHRGNVAQVAAELRLGKSALYDKLKRYGLDPGTYK